MHVLESFEISGHKCIFKEIFQFINMLDLLMN